MKRLIVFFICFMLACPCVYAYERSKNLNSLVEGKSLKVYLGDFKSDTEKIDPAVFKNILKDFLVNRKKERFEIVEDKNNSEIIIESKILAYKYLEKDPVDHVVGGTAGLIVDAFVDQNYAQAQIEFIVYKTGSMRKLWQGKEAVSVTQTNMPEQDSIPKVLRECAKRFVGLCFGKRNK